VFKSGHNGHVIRRGHDIPISTLTRDQDGVDVKSDISDRSDKEGYGKLSQSAPGRGFHYRHSPARNVTPVQDPTSQYSTPVKTKLENQETPKSNSNTPSNKSLIYSDNDTIIKSSNLKNLKNKQLSDKPELIENYTDPSHATVSKMRTVSRELFNDQLEDLAKRRGMATLNRDLSLSNASLGLLSNRSKSMHSLSSNDWEYEERCKVGELLSFEDSSKVGELCRSITSQFSSENQDEDMFLRPRTSSASAVDLGSYNRKQMAFGKTSAEIRRNLASQYAIDPNKNAQKSCSVDNVSPKKGSADPTGVGSDVVQARRMLVARALKNGEPETKGDNPGLSSGPLVSSIDNRSPSPVVMNERRSPSPSVFSSGPKHSPIMMRRSSTPRLGNHTPEKLYGSTQSPSGKMFLSRQSSSPLNPISANSSPDRSSLSGLRTSGSNPVLQNFDKNQLLAANMTKSMQKFMLESPGVGVNTTDYEKLNNKLMKKKKTATSALQESGMRERSSSFSVLTTRQQHEQQFVQQMISEQLKKPRAGSGLGIDPYQQETVVVAPIEMAPSPPQGVPSELQVIHVPSKSYDSTPVSTGGDSGFRSRSQSWSSLSRKSVYESQQHIGVMNPLSNLMSYSEVSLAELPVDFTSQPQRFISVIEDDESVPETLNFSHGRCCRVLL